MSGTSVLSHLSYLKESKGHVNERDSVRQMHRYLNTCFVDKSSDWKRVIIITVIVVEQFLECVAQESDLSSC
jgi:hypothetical protein